MVRSAAVSVDAYPDGVPRAGTRLCELCRAEPAGFTLVRFPPAPGPVC